MTNLPVVVKDTEWPAFVKGRTEAKYERLALPGAYWDRKRKRTYCSEETFRAAIIDGAKWARMLLKHEENGHGAEVPKHDHPTGLAAMFAHAVSVGFDDRSGTRLLRLRWYHPSMQSYERWEREVSEAWKAGRLATQSVSDLLRQSL